MDNFFDQFRENLSRRPDPEFAESDWEALQQRLTPAPKRRAIGWFWPGATAGLGVLLLGSNLAFYHALQRAHAVPVVQRDTVFLTKIVRLTDTVYQLVPAVAHSPRPTSSPEWIWSANSTAPHPAEMPVKMSADRPVTEAVAEAATQALPSADSGDQARWSLLEKLPIRPQILTGAAAPVLGLDSLLAEQPPAPALAQAVTKRRQPAPQGFSLLAHSGLALPIAAGGLQKAGLMTGLEIDWHVSSGLQLWTEVFLTQLPFEALRMDAERGVPLISPPIDDLRFIGARSQQQFRQVAAGATYAFQRSGRWRPLLGIGYNLRWQQPYDLVYEFENEAVGISWTYEQEVIPDRTPASLALLKAGAEYHFFRQWHLQASAGFSSLVDAGKLNRPRCYALQLGLGYRFGF
jgi:hypothetical protein